MSLQRLMRCDAMPACPQATALVDRLGKVSRGLERRNVAAAEGQASMDVRTPSQTFQH